MANIINITDFNDRALDVYVRLTGSQLRNKLEPEKGIFIAESHRNRGRDELGMYSRFFFN